MAFFKNPAVVLASMTFFGLDALAAPQVGGRPRTTETVDTDMSEYTIVPISTISQTSLVPVLPTDPASTTTVTLGEPDIEVFITSRTLVITLPSPSSASSKFTPVFPTLVASTVTVTTEPANPTGTFMPYVPILTPTNGTEIGQTCHKPKENNGRVDEIKSCLKRNKIEDYCFPEQWACQRYVLQKAKECYRRKYHACKKDGFYSALVNAEKEAKALANLRNQKYSPKDKQNKKVYPSR